MTLQYTDRDAFEKESKSQRRLLRQEELILDVIEQLSEALSSQGITKRELAERLGKSKGFVSQILSGGRNLTLRTIADVAAALGCRPWFKLNEEEFKITSTAWVQAFPVESEYGNWQSVLTAQGVPAGEIVVADLTEESSQTEVAA